MKEMKKKKFIITGCGRSGTKYTTELLTELGVKCSHEKIFPDITDSNKGILLRPFYKMGLCKIKWNFPPLGEAAWEATPFLRYISDDVVIFHQVRNPISFIKSRYTKGMTYKGTRKHVKTNHNPYEYENLSFESQILYWASFWIEWNKMSLKNSSKKKYYQYKIEDLNDKVLAHMFSALNIQIKEEIIKEKIKKLSKNINTRKHIQNYINNETIKQILLQNVYLYKILLIEAKFYGYNDIWEE